MLDKLFRKGGGDEEPDPDKVHTYRITVEPLDVNGKRLCPPSVSEAKHFIMGGFTELKDGDSLSAVGSAAGCMSAHDIMVCMAVLAKNLGDAAPSPKHKRALATIIATIFTEDSDPGFVHGTLGFVPQLILHLGDNKGAALKLLRLLHESKSKIDNLSDVLKQAASEDDNDNEDSDEDKDPFSGEF